MTGVLYGLGVGPGDPELITLKALRVLRAAPVVAYPAPDTGDSFARAIAAPHLPGGQVEIAIRIPMRVERHPAREAYDAGAAAIAGHLGVGRDVAVLCEGDPFFYGSFMYLFERLAGRFAVQVVPGVSSLSAVSAAARRPLTARNDVLTVIPGPLDDAALEARIAGAEAFAVMKVGRHLPRVRALFARLGLLDGAIYVERASLAEERVLPLAEAPGGGRHDAPYFSMILGYRGADPAIVSAPPVRKEPSPS